EWAGSVDMTRVRWPRRAHSSAVAAAHVVLPTPPLPVKRRTRGTLRGVEGGDAEARQSPLRYGSPFLSGPTSPFPVPGGILQIHTAGASAVRRRRARTVVLVAVVPSGLRPRRRG